MNSSSASVSSITLEALRNNQDEAWNLAYDELWKVGWLSAKRKLSYDSPEQLEDLVSQVISREVVPQILDPRQEAFVKAKTFEDLLNLTARVISNRAIDEIRKRTRRPGTSDIEKIPESEVVESEDAGKAGMVEEIHLAMSRLGERYRGIVEDFYFEEMSTEEIARKRNRPKGSICSDLMKARQMLGKILADMSEQPTG